jgi:hypothetical protein
MNVVNILIILGCLAVGYWLVSNVMGPGVDITKTKDNPKAPAPEKLLPQINPHRDDWHLLLDVPTTATRADIEAAYKRRVAQAHASHDDAQLEKLQLAYEAALRK